MKKEKIGIIFNAVLFSAFGFVVGMVICQQMHADSVMKKAKDSYRAATWSEQGYSKSLWSDAVYMASGESRVRDLEHDLELLKKAIGAEPVIGDSDNYICMRTWGDGSESCKPPQVQVGYTTKVDLLEKALGLEWVAKEQKEIPAHYKRKDGPREP